ncbi:hypothetical protein NDI56_03940 [Haloarcula sp. S1CR25-12]|uniref:Major tail protein n=1 Tax=Haloarcula saliterrae TaxID=2950534 RepID=A0ABU2F8N7_9EURY|nr:hypothetical protein [Haloarcula sp. S1CR25-12]MDS0258562.1 hypothetical protein [Haloarcula sp. S1CR25-12]
MALKTDATLTVEADIDGDGTLETGKFVMADNINIKPGLRTGFILENRGSTVNSVISSFAKSQSEATGKPQSKRKGIYIDLGGGVRSAEIEFTGWTGSNLQWGNTGDDSELTVGDATGAKAFTQLEVLFHYLEIAEIDSRRPAKLAYGQHHSDGLYEPMDVVLESPQGLRSSDDSSTFSGTLTFLSVQSLDKAIDATGLTG